MKLRILRGGMYADYQAGPINRIKCILTREAEEVFRQKRRRQCGRRGRDGRDVARSQGTLNATRSWRKQGTDDPREHGPASTLTLTPGLQHC